MGMKNKKSKKISETEVAQFWDKNDATEILDLSPKNRLEMVYEPLFLSCLLKNSISTMPTTIQKKARRRRTI